MVIICAWCCQVRGWRQHSSPNRPVLVFGAAEPCVGRKDRSRVAVFITLWTMMEQAESTGIVDVFASTRLICSQLPSGIISKVTHKGSDSIYLLPAVLNNLVSSSSLQHTNFLLSANFQSTL